MAGVYPLNADGGPANRYAAGTFAFVPTTIATTYADDSWAGFVTGQVILDADPGTAGDQSAVFGYDAFATIGGAITAAPANGTIIVSAGTYPEAVSLTGTKTMEISGPAEIVTIQDDRVIVHFLDGPERMLTPERIQKFDLRPGMRIECRWRGGPNYFPGSLSKLEGERLYVNYDDGDQEWTSVRLVRLPFQAR